jgi:hypothetical protein
MRNSATLDATLRTQLEASLSAKPGTVQHSNTSSVCATALDKLP